MATTALVLGIVGLLLFFVVAISIVALVLGLIAASRAKGNPGPNTALGRARAGWILGAVGIAGFVAVAIGIGATGGFDDDEVSVYSLDVGQCVDLDTPSDGPDVVDHLPGRECDEPHDAEVYFVGDLDLGGDDFPGDKTVATEAEELCSGSRFADYVESDFADSELDVFYLYPSAESWEVGDKGYVCLAVTIDSSPLVGSVKGSGR